MTKPIRTYVDPILNIEVKVYPIKKKETKSIIKCKKYPDCSVDYNEKNERFLLRKSMSLRANGIGG
jgi:hypothetical protein